MVNELIKVAEAIERIPGISDTPEKVLQSLPKASDSSPCIRVWLTSDGEIESIEKIAPNHAAQLGKYAPNKFSSLPGFNIKFLQGMTDEDERRKEQKKVIEGLRRNFIVARDEIEGSCRDQLIEGETIEKFLSIVNKINPEQFQNELEGKVRNNDWGWKPPPQKAISIFLDIKDYSEYPVAHTETIKRLNMLLSCAHNESSPTDGKDAYNGDADGLDELFVDINVPRLLGQIKIRSLNKDIPAQERYQRIGSFTFPVGRGSRKRTKSALEWISALENEGCTFGIAGDKELLFAYPISMPQSKTPLARMFGAQDDDELAKEKFGNLAKSVIDQLKGQGVSAKDAVLEIFALRKMDKARTKVVYYRNISIEKLESASKAWDEGCRNIPELSLIEWPKSEKEGNFGTGKKPKAPVLVEQLTVYPIKLHRLANTVWTRDLRQSRVSTFKPGNGLSLLFDINPELSARFMLERFLQHAIGYFIDLCVCLGKHQISKVPEKAVYPGILGLLLFKLHQHKDQYMKETAFLLGRFLRIADEIHRLYCEKVRDGQYPPELCGSSLLTAMQEAPTATLAQLCQRSSPYIKWARAYQKEDAGLVHYWMNNWEPIADTLHGLTLPQRLDVASRAEVFLGYLASFPKKEKEAGAVVPHSNE